MTAAYQGSSIPWDFPGRVLKGYYCLLQVILIYETLKYLNVCLDLVLCTCSVCFVYMALGFVIVCVCVYVCLRDENFAEILKVALGCQSAFLRKMCVCLYSKLLGGTTGLGVTNYTLTLQIFKDHIEVMQIWA